MHRLKGVLLLELSPDYCARAEACFHQALDVARRQGARSLELRAAISLGSLWRDHGKSGEARKLLSEIFEFFNEGFNTIDLKEAKRLLKELG